MLKVGVKNFGPIREGSVALRPLTIFVGPNISGKSYLASLLYTLSGSFSNLALTRIQRWFNLFSVISEPPSTQVEQWLSDRSRLTQTIRFDELPPPVRACVEKALPMFAQGLAGFFDQELQRCFTTKLAELRRKQSRDTLRISIAQNDPSLNMDLFLRGRRLEAGPLEYDLSGWEFNFTEFARILDVTERMNPSVPTANLFPAVAIPQVFRNFFRPSYYLPAARSGILQSHKALTSFTISQLPLIGIESLEVPRLSGVVADFISHLLRLGRQQAHDDVFEVATFLESQVSKGKIDIEATQPELEYPEITYETDGGRYLMHQASSAVSEMAPIVLFLKYVVKKGDLLIIEEPEAHLHPGNQRNLARAIVKLIRLGVHVLITTHSDYFVQQMSNFILLGEMPGERVKLGYSENDYLHASEVGAYLFRFDRRGRGSSIKELGVSDEDGIPEDQFLEIAEAIYDETVYLQRRGVKAS